MYGGDAPAARNFNLINFLGVNQQPFGAALSFRWRHLIKFANRTLSDFAAYLTETYPTDTDVIASVFHVYSAVGTEEGYGFAAYMLAVQPTIFIGQVPGRSGRDDLSA